MVTKRGGKLWLTDSGLIGYLSILHVVVTVQQQALM